MKKTVFTLIFVLALFACLATATYASHGIYDEIGALTQGELSACRDALADASNSTGIGFYVGIGYETESYTYFKSKNGIYDTDAVILLIEYEYGVYYYQMHLFGSAVDKITVSEENKLLDSSEVYDNIKSARLCEGIVSFANQAASYYNKRNFAPVIFFSVSSLVIAVIIFLVVVIKKYKKKQRGTAYPFDEFTSLDLTDERDTFVTVTVTKRRYRSSSSRSGGFGGGGGSRSSSRR